MFGYVNINRQTLSEENLSRYRAYYCGLCEALRRQYGIGGQVTLSYELTFLALLLSSLYDLPEEVLSKGCKMHPLKKRTMILTEAGRYAADMNLLLTYAHLRDDWEDERKFFSRAGAKLLKKKVYTIRERYPDKAQCFQEELTALHRIEEAGERSLDAAACCFGRMIASLFSWKNDAWKEVLSGLGFYLGKYIYLLDAFDDLEKDEKSGSYNVFRQFPEEKTRRRTACEVLNMAIAECTRYYEFLPLVRDAELMRNILYSGVWGAWMRKITKEDGEKNEQRPL